MVYELYIALLTRCVNFNKIDQAVFKYRHLKGFKPIKTKERKLKTMYKSIIKALGPNKKAQVITTINYSILTTNGNLMNINYENLHYQ